MKTAKDLIAVCEDLLNAKRKGKGLWIVNSVEFTDLQWDGGTGWCQRNARKAFEATTGRTMPGASCCAYTTNLALYGRHLDGHRDGVYETATNVEHGGRPEDAQPGDYLYFRGGPACHTCRRPVGHVGIWLGNARMFQHTSRAGLAITDQGPTASQRARFCGAYRLLPLTADGTPVDVDEWAAASVRAVMDAGIMAGVAEGEFGANLPVTRQQLAVVVARMLALPAAGATP